MSHKKLRTAKILVVIVAAALLTGTMVTAGAKIASTGKAPVPGPAITVAPQSGSVTRDHSVFVKRLKEETPEGNAVLSIRFNNRKTGKQLRLALNDSTLFLHDDGKAGDEVAGDGKLSTIIHLDFNELVENQSRIASVYSKANQPPKMSIFRGRVKVGEEEMALPFSDGEIEPDEEVELEPATASLPIDPARSLLITDVRVVEDPTRTFNPCTGVGTPMGKWTFGYIMQQMANQAMTGIDPSTFVRNWLKHWESTQTINGWNVPPRPSVRDTVIIPWEQASGGPGYPLDLTKAPFRLLAIVNRIDLNGNSGYQTSNAGEARFVFGVIDRRANNGCGCTVSEMTVIVEYGIDRKGCEGVKDWAKQWVNLSTIPLGSPAYNAALEAITEQFVKAGAAPHKVNGSALNQLRTNEFLPPITAPWEMREFKLTPGREDTFAANGFLNMTTVKQTPDAVFNNTNTLADYINANCGPIIGGTHIVPLAFPRSALDPPLPNPPAFVGGNSLVPPGAWNAPGIACGPNPPGDARFQFSLATCGGCHLSETATSFYHIRPTAFGTPATLSLFLQGPLAVSDPINGFVRTFDEMKRRAQILDQLANQICPVAAEMFNAIEFTSDEEARVAPSAFIH